MTESRRGFLEVGSRGEKLLIGFAKASPELFKKNAPVYF
jgi:hypothetical protein